MAWPSPLDEAAENMTVDEWEAEVDRLCAEARDNTLLEQKREGVRLVRIADRLIQKYPEDRERIEKAKVKVGIWVFHIDPVDLQFDPFERVRPTLEAAAALPAPKLYLAYEWTEEREGKNHIAACSTVDKAKDACQRRWDDQAADYGFPPTPLRWSTVGSDWVGEKNGSRYDQEYPYEVEEFDLDTVTLNDPTKPGTFKTTRL